MAERHRIYLDNAATTWPKPQMVYDAVDYYQRRLGAAVGRGGYAEAEEVGEIADGTRAAIARLIGSKAPERIIFTANGTDSLNLAIHGVLRPGDHAITTVVEHNSVLRPLRQLEKRKQNQVTRIGCDSTGVIDPEDVRTALRANTKLIILSHASNVTGAIQPVADVGRIAREHGALFLVDAAQTIGHLQLSAADLSADLIAAPGHKGLLGPLGTGFLYIRDGVEELLDSIRQGGTGNFSSSDEQPDPLPHKYESGNQNALGIVGLNAGVRYLEERGLQDIRRHSLALTELLLEGLSDLAGVRIYGPRHAEEQIGVVSFTIANQDPPAIVKSLDTLYRVQARAGFLCAALMHQVLGTIESNGTIRFSTGPFNTEKDIKTAVQAVAETTASRTSAVGGVSCPCVAVSTADAETSAAAEADAASPCGMDISAIPGLQNLWNQTLGDPDICIAVLDGPVDLSHPCFDGADVSALPSTVASQPDGGPASQHGTHVASVIFGQHQSPVKGVAPKCRGISVPIFKDKDDNSFTPCSQIALARAISQATEAGADIINISGGQFSPSGAAHPLLADAVKRCAERGVLVIAAAGNQGCECLHIPGAIPSVLVVGAMNAGGEPLGFSNWGYGERGVLAVGEHILGARAGGGTQCRSGTSYAAPIASGIAALLMSLRDQYDLLRSASLVRSTLLSTVTDCGQQNTSDCARLLAGRINVSRAHLSINTGERNMSRFDRLPPSVDTKETHHENMASTPIPADHGVLPAGLQSRVGENGRDHLAPSPAANSKVSEHRRAGEQKPQDEVNTQISPAQLADDTPMARTQQIQASVLPSCSATGDPTGQPQKVYALGKLDFDYGSRSRRVYFANAMKQAFDFDPGGPGVPDVDSAENLYNYLVRRSDADYNILGGKQFYSRAEVGSFIWILKIDETPIYAIAPLGPVALDIHDALVGFLNDQLLEGAERVSIPGIIVGETQLFFGETVPVIQPDIRGMFSWKTSVLAAATQESTEASDQAREDLEEFLTRVYDQTRNLGITSEERAINYAATDALVSQAIFSEVHEKQKFQGYELDQFSVEKSPICQQGMDCWDVHIIFYDPNNLQRARRGFRFTIDVSDVMPVLLGHRKEFSLR